MSTWLGIALALSLTHLGTNGLDPATLVLFLKDGKFELEPTATDFLRWLSDDPVERASTMRHFVACAFDDKTEIKVGRYTWRGVFGLAQPSLVAISAGKPGRLLLRPDDGKWLSACLMAFANKEGWHEYISLRGNPPGAASSQVTPFKPTPAERWTMGFPEGVFVADLLNFNYDPVGQPLLARREPRPADLDKSYTLSLNLPQNHREDWAPPNAAVGRTYDYDRETKVRIKGLGKVRIARRIGKSAARYHKAEGTPSPDQDYAQDAICVDGAVPSVVSCNQAGAGAPLRPLFVHGPRVVNFTPLDAEANPALTMQAVGGPATMKECPLPRPSHRCVGPFGDVSVISGPEDAKKPLPKTRFLKLAPGEGVVALLRFVEKNEPGNLVKQVKEEGSLDVKYTAIVRYRSASAATAPVKVSDENGLERDAGEIWPSTGGAFQWLQVFPVYPLKDDRHSGGQKALKISITGNQKSPELDVAGFVPGPPWCHAGEGPFMDVCRGEPCQGEPLRLHPARAPKPRPPGRE